MNTTKARSNQVACRLNTDQIELLDIKAKEKGLNRSLYVKSLIIDHLNKDIEDKNLLLSRIEKITEKLEQNELNVEFFIQYFNAFLTTWFYSHPKIEDDSNKTRSKQTLDRKESFDRNFMENIFDENVRMFNKLLTSVTEES